MKIETTLFERAQRFVGLRELAGAEMSHPLIQWWLSLCGYGLHAPDSTPWCSAAMNGWAWDLRLPRSKSAAARSWINVGRPIRIEEARPEFDVLVFKRGPEPQPGPEVITAPGHVGAFADLSGKRVWCLGGNQDDGVSIAPFDVADVLAVRRLFG